MSFHLQHIDFYNIIVDVIDYGEGVGERL